MGDGGVPPPLQGAGEVVNPPPAVSGAPLANPAVTDTLIEPGTATSTGAATPHWRGDRHRLGAAALIRTGT